MRKRKKIISILGAVLSLLMIFTVLPAYAEETAPPEKGSITIHKYSQGKKEGSEATGLELSEAEIPKGAEPLANVKFVITKLQDTTDKKVDQLTKADDIVDGMKSTTTYTVTTGDGEKGTVKGVVTKGGLKFGTYLVEEVKNEAVTDMCAPFIVVLPMSNPKGNGLIYDVHVYPKNKTEESPIIDKYVTKDGQKEDSASYNEAVKWIIEPTVPAGMKEAKQYTVTDTIDSRLDKPENIRVYYKDESEQDAIMLDKTEYKTSFNKETRILTIDFTKDGRIRLGDSGAKKIYIEFTTKLNSSAEPDIEVPNQAHLTYTNGLGQSFTPESGKPKVYTGGIKIAKVDAASGKPLAGAKFKIYTKDTSGSMTAVKNNKGKEIEVETKLIDKEVDGKSVQVAEAEFVGLKYGTYYIKETQAPSYTENNKTKYYHLINGYQKVTVRKNSYSDSKYVVKVANSKSSLPLTGGRGVTIFLLTGLILMAGAGTVYVINKKKIAK